MLEGCNRRGFLNNSDSRPSNSLFQIARGSGGLHSVSALFLQKSARHRKYFFKADHFKTLRQKEPRLSHIRVLFDLQRRNRAVSRKRPSSSLCQTARGSGATPKWEYFFLQKGTHHAKISRSATRFRSRKHSDDACSCSTRPEGTRRGF